MSRRRQTLGLWTVGGVFAVAALAAGAAAIAGTGRGPTTERAAGTYTLAPVNVKQRTCTGTDGTYVQARGVLEGASTSSDPRFNGRVQVVIERALVNLATGNGTSRGRVTWWDASGRRTVTATYHEVVT